MRPRTFSLIMAAGGFALLAATMAANVLLDPQMMFGTPLTRDDENANYRFHRLRQYQAGPERLDGLLFASSRGRAFAPGLLAENMGIKAVAKFDVPAAMITDHWPALQYVVRDKAARGERIEAVLLLLDIDTFGKPAATNVNIDSFLPPELSGEPAARFWWRYLTVFQFRIWREMVVRRLRPGGQFHSTGLSARPLVIAGFGVPLPRIAGPPISPTAADPGHGKLLVATRPDLEAHLDLLRRFVSLCRDNGIRLAVATTPIRADARSLYYPEDLDNVVERLSRVVTLWDFAEPSSIAGNLGLWDDSSHFKPEVAAMMLMRIYGGASQAPSDFGVFRQAPRG